MLALILENQSAYIVECLRKIIIIIIIIIIAYVELRYSFASVATPPHFFTITNFTLATRKI